MNELYAEVFARSYGFKAIGLRYFKVFGKRQDPDGAYAAVIPKWTAAKLGIDTHEVLAAAGTKWNFLPFKPGLVGGHCIGVDPYYLTHKAQAIGYNPEIILAARWVQPIAR